MCGGNIQFVDNTIKLKRLCRSVLTGLICKLLRQCVRLAPTPQLLHHHAHVQNRSFSVHKSCKQSVLPATCAPRAAAHRTTQALAAGLASDWMCSVSGRVLLRRGHDTSQHVWWDWHITNCQTIILITACAAGTYNALTTQSSASACIGVISRAFAILTCGLCSVSGGHILVEWSRSLLE